MYIKSLKFIKKKKERTEALIRKEKNIYKD